MAVSAYILIQPEGGKPSAVVDTCRPLAGVVQADDVTGPYDVILRAEADSIDELGRMVVSQIQLVDGITRTLTCPVVHLSFALLVTLPTDSVGRLTKSG